MQTVRLSIGLFGVVMIVALTARAEAQLSPRLRMVARGMMQPRARVTARLHGGAARLQSLGFPARTLSDEVATVELDAAGLAWLGANVGDARIEEHRVLLPQLDRATAAIGATAVRQETGLSGRGTLVGVVDTGIDFRHADLRNLDGSTRVQALLDHRTPVDARHAELGSFGGALWHKDEIDALLAAEAAGTPPPLAIPEADIDGHGTHVASLAASNGLATGKGLPAGRYVGVAPEAGLLIAQTSSATGSFTDVDVLDACRFMLAEKRALGRPLVVNISLGGTGGPHDGSTNIERSLDELFPRDQPGLALTVAAGNLGFQDLHAGGWRLADEEAITLHLDEASVDGNVSIDLWYRGDLAIAIESPSGRRSSWIERGKGLDIMYEGEGRVLVENGGTTLPSGLVDGAIVLEGLSATRPGAGDWKIWVRGPAIRYDLWLESSPLSGLFRFSDHVVSDDNLTVPATSHGAISVGSVSSRFDWLTFDAGPFVVPVVDPTSIGNASRFSGMGPTSDGRFAPDVAAPGEFILGAMSRDAPPTVDTSVFHTSNSGPRFLWGDDGLHGALRGTSQASPIVAGVIALLFEADPTLTSEAVREILRATATPVPGTAGWSPRVGFGRVDAQAAVRYLRGLHGMLVDAATSPVGVSRDQLPPDSDETTTVTVTPRDQSGLPLGPGHQVAITLSAGAPLGEVVDIGSGRYERSFVAHAPRGATGVATAIVDGVTLAEQPRVFFVVGRNEIGGALRPGGGCDLGGTPVELPGRGNRFPWPTVVGVVLWLMLALIRRSSDSFAQASAGILRGRSREIRQVHEDHRRGLAAMLSSRRDHASRSASLRRKSWR